ncbi:MAG TPA: hypothetical protein VFR75_10265 [Solirubrobacterales bacterium]|nr:hypothetical protein [Solirubrobacterales bacterium]
MKQLKIAALLAVAAAALTAFAAAASASPTLTSPAGTAYFGTLHAETEVKHAVLIPTNAPAIECNSTAQGAVVANGTPASVESGSLTFGSPNCTNSWHVTAASAGTLTISSAGAITSSGVTVEATRFGVVCRYASSGTTLGTLTDSGKTGGTATMHIEASIPRHNGSALCGEKPTKWEGSYKIGTPDVLYLD